MDRRGFFRIPLAAVVGSAVAAPKTNSAAKFTTDAPRAGDVLVAPAGALEVDINGKIYHLYLFEPKK